MSLNIIREKLKSAYTYVVAPVAMLDTPVALPDMAKIDVDGNPDGYYTLNELSDALGNQFSMTPKIDERFITFRWSINMNGVEKMIIDYLLAQNLVNMRDNGLVDGLDYEVYEIDYTTLNGNEFGIFSIAEVRDVPNPVIAEV